MVRGINQVSTDVGDGYHVVSLLRGLGLHNKELSVYNPAQQQVQDIPISSSEAISQLRRLPTYRMLFRRASRTATSGVSVPYVPLKLIHSIVMARSWDT